MSGSFEKSVKGGTKIKLAPPKAKYVEHILVATHTGDAGVAEIFRALQNRLRDSTWTIVFKSLIIAHLMIREGEPNVTLKYLADNPSKLAISNFSDVQIQGTNIRHYYNYILARAKAYRDTRIDWVREGQGRLKRQTVDKGLLRETESVQNQISNLLRCDLLSTEAENEITVCAFRLLTMDLLVLYGVMNEGTINVLEHYFEMSKYDAERALTIYKTFTKQTNVVVEFLSTARQYENATRLEIPKLKHAPTSLTSSLEEYLHDPDFEINRRQYLAQQEAKKGRKPSSNKDGESSNMFRSQPINKGGASNAASDPKPAAASAPPKAEPKGPAPDLIDFFDSIEQNQQPMATQPQPQAPQFQSAGPFQQQQQVQPQPFPQQQIQDSGFGQQQAFYPTNNPPQIQSNGISSTNPFGQVQQQQPPAQPVQPDFTGAGFGGYSPQPFTQTQNSIQTMSSDSGSPFATQQQQPFSPNYQSFGSVQQQSSTGSQSQASNPFRQSAFPQNTGSSMPTFTTSPPLLSPQSTNPFARNLQNQTGTSSQNSLFGPQAPNQNSPFTSPPPPQPQQQPVQQQLTPQRTGTNPFARSNTLPASHFSNQPAQPVTSNATGSTNPFRQSTFVNNQTGQSWQSNQGTMGGFEQLDTVPIFPRPGQQQPTGQQPQAQQQQPNFWP